MLRYFVTAPTLSSKETTKHNIYLRTKEIAFRNRLLISPINPAFFEIISSQFSETL